jgi:hypothetical protein
LRKNSTSWKDAGVPDILQTMELIDIRRYSILIVVTMKSLLLRCDHVSYVRFLLIFLKNVFISISDSMRKQQASTLLAAPQPRRRYS